MKPVKNLLTLKNIILIIKKLNKIFKKKYNLAKNKINKILHNNHRNILKIKHITK